MLAADMKVKATVCQGFYANQEMIEFDFYICVICATLLERDLFSLSRIFSYKIASNLFPQTFKNGEKYCKAPSPCIEGEDENLELAKVPSFLAWQ